MPAASGQWRTNLYVAQVLLENLTNTIDTKQKYTQGIIEEDHISGDAPRVYCGAE